MDYMRMTKVQSLQLTHKAQPQLFTTESIQAISKIMHKAKSPWITL